MVTVATWLSPSVCFALISYIIYDNNLQYNLLTNNYFNAVIAEEVLLNDFSEEVFYKYIYITLQISHEKVPVHLAYTLASLFPRKPANAVIITISYKANL